MTRDQAREYINSNPQLHLTKARKDVQGHPTFICPFCGNGSGTSGDGLTTKDGTHWHCFKCGFNGDMVELIAQEQGIKDGGSREAFDAARAVYGLDVDNAYYTHNAPVQHIKEEEIKIDSRAFIKEHCKPGCDTSYLQARGISKAVAERLHFGYNEKSKAVVIPITKAGGWYYIERYTEPMTGANGEPVRYHVPKGGTNSGIFNEAALDQGEPVFITEGAINAASIVEAGGYALAINSTSNARTFIKRLEERESKCKRFVVCMDNDAAGASAAATLMKGLTEELGVEAIEYQHAAGYNDINDELLADKEALKKKVEKITNSFNAKEVDEIKSHKVGAMLDDFWKYVGDEKNNKPIPTCFSHFNKAIGGGLLPKFYIIGAISSLGKTTFVLQIADYIAAHGNDVLLFSLEMSKEDIIARSISRLTYEIEQEACRGTARAKTELGIVMGSRYSKYSEEEIALIKQATGVYRKYASDHISIYEGKHTADRIKEITEKYITLTGRIPVVVVDYLQILQPAPGLIRATMREQTDYNIDVFAAMRRELKTPIIGISSFNRQSYTTVADNSSFKESGSIEYSGDCVITLELDFERPSGKDAENKTREVIKEALRKEPRDIKLTFQKNRGNKLGTTLYYQYYAKFNRFEEDFDKDTGL